MWGHDPTRGSGPHKWETAVCLQCQLASGPIDFFIHFQKGGSRPHNLGTTVWLEYKLSGGPLEFLHISRQVGSRPQMGVTTPNVGKPLF